MLETCVDTCNTYAIRKQYGATWDLQSGHTCCRSCLKLLFFSFQTRPEGYLWSIVTKCPYWIKCAPGTAQHFNTNIQFCWGKKARNHCAWKLNHIEATCLTPCIRGFLNNLVGYFPNWKHTCTVILWGKKEIFYIYFYYLKSYLKSLYFLNHTNRQVSVQIHTVSICIYNCCEPQANKSTEPVICQCSSYNCLVFLL